ncbi:MAG: hypothetical protein CMF62_03680 [Magnetococcales bacterium]|nr:hypothetical protein [Magnetococcales bacterium]
MRFLIIIPYKYQDKEIYSNLVIHINNIFNKLNFNDYKIIGISQGDDLRKFNKGSLINVGFKISEDLNPNYLIIQDVYYKPDEKMCQNYLKEIDSIVHYSYNKDNTETLEGVFGISIETFKKINGYSNCGWGFDNINLVLLKRLEIIKQKRIQYPTSGTFIIKNNSNNLSKRMLKLLKIQESTYLNDGLSNVDYDILDKKDSSYKIHLHQSCYHLKNYSLRSEEKCQKYLKTFKNLFDPILTSNDLINRYIISLRKKYPINKTNIKLNNYLPKGISELLNNPIFKSQGDNNFKQTLDYVWNIPHKGIYIKITDNKIKALYRIVNNNPKNDWYKNLGFKRSTITNNCLVEPVADNYGFYSSVFPNFFYLLKKTCENRKVKDCEFFFNKRDYPILRKDLKHPFDMVYPKGKLPQLVDYNSLIPFLGITGREGYLDIVIPNQEDILFVFKKHFPSDCKNIYNVDTIDKYKWEDKINKAVFRGKATGCGVTVNTNQRLKLASIAKNNPKIDAGITKWNRRPKAYYGKMTMLNKKKLPFGLSSFMSREEQFKHRYLICIDGHVRGFRLNFELSSNSLVLLVESSFKFKMFSDYYIEPFVHYVPIKHDLSDLDEKIKWCDNNQDKCKEIVSNAQKKMKEIMNRDFFYNYTADLLNSLP